MDPSFLIPDPFNSAMNLHPMFVHFPLALLPVGLLLLLLAWWRGGESWLFAAKPGMIQEDSPETKSGDGPSESGDSHKEHGH